MINEVRIIGRLGKDPEVKTLQGGAKVASLSVATERAWKKNDEWQKETTWHRVVAWDFAANHAEKFCKKGGMVYVAGRITHREYETKDGEKKVATEIVADNIRSLERTDSAGGGGGGSPSGGNATSTSSAPKASKAATPPDDDDVPF